jgi:acetyl-CoA acyltransferase
MKEVVIAGYLRTAQTRSTIKEPERDWFYKISADELLSKLIGGLINKTGINPKEIADFLVGCAFGVNEQWTYGG